MDKLHTVSRWFGIVALGVAGVALWRSESGATEHASNIVVRPPVIVTQPAPTAPPPTTVLAPSPIAAPTPAPSIAPAVSAHASGALHVRRFVLARGVVDRTPVEPGTSFHMEPTDRLFAFVDAGNGTGHDDAVVIEFQRNGTLVSEVTLDVPAQPRWRTWGFTRMVHTPGHFTAVVRSRDGAELARTEFDVT